MAAFHRRVPARAALIFLSSCLLVSGLSVGARAQEPGEVSIALVSQPQWHEPKDAFNLRFRITNDGITTLDGFRLQLRVFEPAESRSELHENFEVDPTRVESDSLPVDRADVSIPAGSSTNVTISEDIEEVGFLSTATTSGVYPITITVTDTQGLVALDTLTTQLIYLPNDVEVPLNVAFVWPLSDIPSRGAGGAFETELGTSTTRLEDAVAEGGWLRGVSDALSLPAAEGLRFGFAPGPRLIEEIGNMSGGYTRREGGEVRTIARGDAPARAAASILEQLRTIVEAGDAQPILAPYSLPDLPSLQDLEQLTSQVTVAETIFEEFLRSTPGRAWIFPPGGRLDQSTLERLHSTDAAASIFASSDSLAPAVEGTEPGCRSDFVGITYTCPIAATTAAGRARGFVLDAELQERFAALKPVPGDPLLFQRLIAETAMIWAELPGAADRVVALAAPPLWHPPPRIAARFIRVLARAPWLTAVAPRTGLHLGIGAVERELVPDAPLTRTQPDDTYLEEVSAAIDVVESFALLQPPLSLIQRLKRDALVAQSRMWWGDALTLQRGARFAEQAKREAAAELAKISIEIGGRADITLTSSKGPVPLVLQNNTEYDVNLEVHIESTDRDLEITDRIISDTFAPGATTLPVEASARSSGIYPVRILVATSDGYEVYETSISIRSTEFNEIALGITVGALAFLVMFYVLRSSRRRRNQQPQGDD